MDPLDPQTQALVQLLVQDRLFIASVQTSQLHAAAAAAVRILKGRINSYDDYRRPDVQGRGRGRGRIISPLGETTTPRTPGLGPAIRALQQEILSLEDEIPWTMVRKAWKAKRSTWRRHVKSTEVIGDIASRLKELRTHLLTDDATFLGCGPAWQSALEICMSGRGSFGHLFSVWDEMRNTIKSWLEGKMTIDAQCSLGAQYQGSAIRAIQALQVAVKSGDETLLQTPLEAIVGNDTQGLHAVRQAIELERRMVAARLAVLEKEGITEQDQALVSYFNSINAPWDGADFDSGAEEDVENASDVTDIDEEFD